MSAGFKEASSEDFRRYLRMFNASPRMFEFLKDILQNVPLTDYLEDEDVDKIRELIQQIEQGKYDSGV